METNPLKVLVEKRKQTEKPNLDFLDGLRGLAALIVMIGHARWLLWEGYTEGFLKHPEQYSIVGKAIVYVLAVFKYGHQSVLFFFVLSGFVIHLRYSRNLKKNEFLSFDWKDYFFRRIKRIYPPFLFILLLTWLLDSVGAHLGYSIYYGRTPNALLNANVGHDHGFINLIGNLFFLQSEKIGIWGSNGPLWSLKYEWWFYVLYPFLFLINRKSPGLGILVVTTIFLIICVTNYHPTFFFLSVLQYLFCWWLGCILADIYTGRINIDYKMPALCVLAIPMMLVMEKIITDSLLSDMVWAVGFFGLLNGLFYLRQRGVSFKSLNDIKWLGDCSYTLYIIHFPILVFFNGVLLKYNNNKMPGSTGFVFAGIIICVSIAWVAHFVTEKPFIKKRIA